MDSGGRVRALLATKKERGRGLDLGNLGSQLRFAPDLGLGGPGGPAETRKGEGGSPDTGTLRVSLRAQSVRPTLGVFVALGRVGEEAPPTHSHKRTLPGYWRNGYKKGGEFRAVMEAFLGLDGVGRQVYGSGRFWF